MNKITIYTNETCPYCKEVKKQLKENNIEFKNVLTSDEKDNWQAIVNLTGMPTVPTLNFNGDYLVPGRDFGNAANLINLIQNYKESNFTIQEITLEKLKTLNYNISTAFNRTNQILTQIENKLKDKENDK
jgi:glutaredoxin 3|tara:strand:- start:64 stop:453 length:390 start_codon:yes stop_codon:yes gene_type:complete